MKSGYDERACMGISRFTRAPLPLLICASIWLVATPPAAAQEAAVTLRLEAQTPWTTLKEPVLRLRVRAENLSDQVVEDLSLGLALGAAVRARSEYDTMMIEGPPFVMFAPAPTPAEGPLPPGTERTFGLEADLTGAVSTTDSLVYPGEITLFGEGRPVASLPIPIVNLVREPEVPIRFTWWTTLASGPVFDTAGRLADAGFEATIAEGGGLAETARALAGIAARDLPTSITVVIEPLLVEQLGALADGYERREGSVVVRGEGPAADAERVLAELRSAFNDPAIHAVQLPYAAPAIPAMLRSGLRAELDRQYGLAEEVMKKFVDPVDGDVVATAPHDMLDDAALAFLADRGATVVLAEAGTVTRPAEDNFFAPAPTARVPMPDGDEMALVLPDPGAQALFERPELRDDPVRLTQTVLGELAVVWREQPVPAPPVVRGIALSLPPDLPAEAWLPLTQRLATAPFLDGTDAPTLASSVHPSGSLAGLVASSTASFSSEYVRDLRIADQAIDSLANMLIDTSHIPADLRRDLAVAESGEFIGLEASGRAWVRSVTGHTRSRFERLAPIPDQVFTLTSATGTIPIRFGRPLEPYRVVVELQSSWFSFPDGSSRTVTLRSTDQPVPFTVEASGGGRRSIRVLVRAEPAGPVIASRDIVVGSSTANRLALLITAAAGLTLVALWARRLLPRTKT
jgi:hypothetical protein